MVSLSGFSARHTTSCFSSYASEYLLDAHASQQIILLA